MAVSIRHVGLSMMDGRQHNGSDDSQQQANAHAQRGKQYCEQHGPKRDHDEPHVPWRA